jgi:hypothetical protein
MTIGEDPLSMIFGWTMLSPLIFSELTEQASGDLRTCR